MFWKHRRSISDVAAAALPATHPTAGARATGPWRVDSVALELSDAGLTAMVVEQAMSADFVSRMDAFNDAMTNASPDLAIAMWQRFHALVRSATVSHLADHAVLQKHLAVAPDRDAAREPDVLPDTLATIPEVVSALGRWRASAQFRIAARLAQCQATSPTAMLRATHYLVAVYAQVVRDDIDECTMQHVRAWRDQRGERFEIDRVFVRCGATGVSVRAVIRRPA